MAAKPDVPEPLPRMRAVSCQAWLPVDSGPCYGRVMQTYFAVWRSRGPNWDPSLTMREQALWAEHAAFMNDLAAQGFVVLGGPLGHGEEFLLIVDAESDQTVRDRFADDPWSDAGLLTVQFVSTWTVLLDAGRQ